MHGLEQVRDVQLLVCENKLANLFGVHGFTRSNIEHPVTCDRDKKN